MSDVYELLNEADAHTATLSDLLRGIRSFEDEKKTLDGVVMVIDKQKAEADRYQPATDSVEYNANNRGHDSPQTIGSKYVPTEINEKFQYTNIPNSNVFYNAKVVAFEDTFISIVHIGKIDCKYGKGRINIETTKFRPPLATIRKRKKRGQFEQKHSRPSKSTMQNKDDAYIPPSTMTLPGNSERMHFVMNRPSSRQSAVRCMLQLDKADRLEPTDDFGD